MPIADSIKTLLNRPGIQSISLPLINGFARLQGHGVRQIFPDDGVWVHRTSRGYFAYHQPYLRLDFARLDEFARRNFFWGYTPKPGNVIVDIGAGVGEEALTFARAVGERGRVICIEAHPRTYRCLEKLVQYNRLHSVIAIHAAVTEPGCSAVTIGTDPNYLASRLHASSGTSVPASTIDEIHRRLQLGRVHFLKMNIEGSERLAIRGMAETVRQIEILCISCHDFLSTSPDQDELRTKNSVREFLRQNGLELVERVEAGLPPYLRDQVWAYNRRLLRKPAA